ncbi:hypothetical protein MHTCC0001_36000 [Flavobacteriaceae bacterium MHTCC 0001]
MALKRRTYTLPSEQARRSDEEEGAEVVTQPLARARVKRPLVQILVVVANIQMRTLKTEVEKGSM